MCSGSARVPTLILARVQGNGRSAHGASGLGIVGTQYRRGIDRERKLEKIIALGATSGATLELIDHNVDLNQLVARIIQ